MKVFIKIAPLLIVASGLAMTFQNCAPNNPQWSEENFSSQAPTQELDLYKTAAIATTQTAQAWTAQGCNTTSYHQDPVDPTLFWGRRLKYSGLSGENSSNECTWKTWGIALYKADFNQRKMTFMRYALKPANTAISGARTLTTAYDPTVAIISGVKYVAFECHGSGFKGSASTCIGTVDSNNNVVIAKTRVYVDGVASQDSTAYASASVPKLFTALNGKTYLSWTQVLINKADGKWRKLTSRTLLFNPAMAMIASDALGPVNTYNPTTVPGTADLFDVKQITSDRYLFTGARGENGCLTPLDLQSGCYRLEVGAVNNVLTHNAFDYYSQQVYTLPDNPIEYFRWTYDPLQKTWGVFGSFLRKAGTATTRTLNPGLYFISIANAGTSLPVKNVGQCTASQPSPHWGVKNGACLRSCGGLGGTKASTTSCASQGLKDMGAAYDVPYCCGPICNPTTQPSPNWGVRSGQCLKSCGALGGKYAYQTSCAANGKIDAGQAYDVPYCCK